MKEIEEMFKVEEVIKTSNLPLTKQKENKGVMLLNSKKFANVSVVLSRIKLPFNEIREAIECANTDVLSLDKLQVMKTMLPSEEEAEIIENYLKNDGDVALLGSPEKFFIELLKINRLNERFEAIIQIKEFPEKFQITNKELKSLSSGLNLLINSQEYKDLLQIVLAVGNYMNGSTFRGGARGFHYEVLSKLNTVKSTSSHSINLTHFLADFIEKKHPSLKNFYHNPNFSETINVCSKIDLDFALSQSKELEDSFVLVENEHNFALSTSEDCKLVSIFGGFLKESSQQISSIKILSNTLKADFEKARSFFVLEKETSCQEFFRITHQFLASLDKASIENVQRNLRIDKFKLRKNISDSPKGDLDSMISRMKNFK